MSISRLCLGTAKLGMPWYGAGSISRPTHADSAALLRRAYTLRIRQFDTATAYGDAELLLLKYLPRQSFRVSTKVAPDLWTVASAVTRWRPLFLHNPTLVEIDSRADGASVYTPEEAYAVMDARLILQVPYCLLDRRHEQVIVDAKARGVTVFARQPFLQGVLINGYTNARSDVDIDPAVLQVCDDIWSICAQYNISRVEACLWLSLNTPADYIVFGSGSVAHLEEVCAAASRPVPEQWPACKAELLEAVKDVPPVVFQSVWRKA